MLTVAIDRNQYRTSRRTNGDRHPTGQLQPTRLVVLLPATVDAMIERRQGEVNADGGHEQCGRHRKRRLLADHPHGQGPDGRTHDDRNALNEPT